MNELTIGIDLSTHGAKVLAVDRCGKLHAWANTYYRRSIKESGIQEQSLEAMENALYQALRQVTQEILSIHQVKGVAITHQRGTLIGLDGTGCALTPAICDGDIRSWPQARKLAEKIGSSTLYEHTGCPPLPFNGLTKILWWNEEIPEIAHKVKYWVSVQDWAVFLLTGTLASSPGSALRLGVLNIHQPLSYSDKILNEIGVPINKFLPLLPFDQPLGYVSQEASINTGLPEGVPVFPAPGDQPASILGTGAIVHNLGIINLGTSFVISIPVHDYIPPSPDCLYTLEVLPDYYYAIEYGEGAGTNVLDWLTYTLFELPSISELSILATNSPLGANGVIVVPHWWAATSDAHAGAIHGLSSSHTRSDIARATLEGLAHELRWSWEKLSSTSNLDTDGFIVCGGAANNDLLCNLISAILHKPIKRPKHLEAAALGAAISAAMGLRWYPDYQTASMNLTQISRVFEASVQESNFYEVLYQRYLQRRRIEYESLTG